MMEHFPYQFTKRKQMAERGYISSSDAEDLEDVLFQDYGAGLWKDGKKVSHPRIQTR